MATTAFDAVTHTRYRVAVMLTPKPTVSITTIHRKKPMKRIGVIAALILTLCASAISVGVYVNNRSEPVPTRAQIDTALARTIRWMQNHQNTVLRIENPMLWHMVQRSAQITGAAPLKALFARYRARYLRIGMENSWRPLFNPHWGEVVHFSQVAMLPYYNKLFLYGLSCSRGLAAMSSIRRQMKSGFCAYSLRPACATHQLMGIDLAIDHNCGDTAALRRTAAAVRDRIARQSFWDFRLVDVYIQRVLMLYDSRDRHLVKAVWLHRILNAQRPDGGWSEAQPLLPLPGGRKLVFSGRGIAIRRPASSFHTTAQALLLLSLLSETAPTAPQSGPRLN